MPNPSNHIRLAFHTSNRMAVKNRETGWIRSDSVGFAQASNHTASDSRMRLNFKIRLDLVGSIWIRSDPPSNPPLLLGSPIPGLQFQL
jgi:hypothetical protein